MLSSYCKLEGSDTQPNGITAYCHRMRQAVGNHAPTPISLSFLPINTILELLSVLPRQPPICVYLMIIRMVSIKDGWKNYFGAQISCLAEREKHLYTKWLFECGLRIHIKISLLLWNFMIGPLTQTVFNTKL